MLIWLFILLAQIYANIHVDLEAKNAENKYEMIKVEPMIDCDQFEPKTFLKGEKEDKNVKFKYKNVEYDCEGAEKDLVGGLKFPCPSKCQLCPKKCEINATKGKYNFTADFSLIDTNHNSEHNAAVFHMVKEEREQKLILRSILVVVLVVSLFFFGFVYGSDDY